MKIPVIKKDDYTIYYESDGNGSKIVHADINKWNKRIRNKLMMEWKILRSLCNYEPIFAVHDVREHSNPEKHKKFLKIMGFEFVAELNHRQFLYVCKGD